MLIFPKQMQKTEPQYEIFKGTGSLDIRIFLHKVSVYPYHWHYANEFLFILDGEAKITIGEETDLYKEGDLLLINPFIPHMISAPESVVMLALQVNSKYFGNGTRFEVNSVKHPNEDYSNIVSILANLIKFHSEAGPNHELLMQSIMLKLKYEMLTKYKVASPGNEEEQRFEKHFAKFQNILRYIQENFRYDISLTEVAEKFFYSPSYLSRSFEKMMGVSFKKYVNNLRLTEAVADLLTSDKTIDAIALESGFPNTRSFVSLHKEVYGNLPSERRKTGNTKTVSSNDENYMDFKKTDYLSKLAPYLDRSGPKPANKDRADIEKISIKADARYPQGKLTHTFKKFTSVARASDLLKQNVREMLATTQKEIGFEYIKFHGILDDDLSVYSKGSDGHPIMNFDAIDNIIDFLSSIHLKPLIQLSFMPKDLAKYPNKTTFFKPIITSEPANMDEWVAFIQAFVHHLLSRYGAETVETWPFSLWNEPESDQRLFGLSDPSVFKEFYLRTYKAVKEICPSIKFGGTSLIASTYTETTYFEDNFLSDPTAIPDFINLHFYPLKSATFNDSNISGPVFNLSSNPYILTEYIAQLKAKMASLNLSHLPIYITEWNSTTSHRDLLNDTAFKGAYVARNIIDNYDAVDSFGYWCLTDDMLELPAVNKLFHGGIGLFTKTGIKKPPYYAFRFLSELGDGLLIKRKGCILTEDKRGFQSVLVNYIHYSDIYAAGELFDASSNNRYAPFRSNRELTYEIEISDVINGTYLIEEYIVNRQYGSCYDIWEDRFHGEEPVTQSAVEALKEASIPKYCMNKVTVENSILKYKARLLPHEIRLVKIKRL